MQNRGAIHQRDGAPVRRREECRPLAPGIPTSHARTPLNTDLSRKLCAIAAAGETPANGVANGSMHSLRAILNNLMAISPNTDPLTQGRERVGASPQEYRPLAQDSHCAENVGCGSVERWPRDLSAGAAAKEYRPLTQESAVRASKIQTFRTRNADLSRKAAPGNSCKSIYFADRLPFPCCSCLCLMFC
jgi:hypothetical protein